jgi:sulfur relay protein TusB/DsrH
MLVMIKSAPDTTDGALGLTLARESGSDLILLQNGIYFAQKERLGTVSGAVYVLDDDKRLRGLRDAEMDARIKIIGYDTLTDIITSGVRVTGMF